MNAAKRHRVTRDDGAVSEDYELVRGMTLPRRRFRGTPPRPLRDLRLLRDRVWLLLSDQGLTPEEIAEACRLAARSKVQIWRRLKQARASLHERQADVG